MNSLIKLSIATTFSFLLIFAFQTSISIGAQHISIDHGVEHWKTRAAKVTLGMKRSDVDMLLPRNIRKEWSLDGSWDQKREFYYLDDRWAVTIIYQYKDRAGKLLNSDPAYDIVKVLPKIYHPRIWSDSYP